MTIVIRNVDDLDAVLTKVRRCTLCEGLPLGPSPILQATSNARILIAGQAPGRITHERGRPFDDASGDRLRTWLGVDSEVFYESGLIAALPMGFCFPGSGSGGDLAPRKECAPTWRNALLQRLPQVQLTLVMGQYALAWHLGDRNQSRLADTVRQWRTFWPELLPMPHPSPRNNRWLKQNPFFESDILPVLQKRVRKLLKAN